MPVYMQPPHPSSSYDGTRPAAEPPPTRAPGCSVGARPAPELPARVPEGTPSAASMRAGQRPPPVSKTERTSEGLARRLEGVEAPSLTRNAESRAEGAAPGHRTLVSLHDIQNQLLGEGLRRGRSPVAEKLERLNNGVLVLLDDANHEGRGALTGVNRDELLHGLEDLSTRLSNGASSVDAMRELAERFELDPTSVDVHALVQWVLRDAYLDTSASLFDYARKVQFFNEVKRAIRTELEQARGMQLQLQQGGAVSQYASPIIETSYAGQVAPIITTSQATAVSAQADSTEPATPLVTAAGTRSVVYSENYDDSDSYMSIDAHADATTEQVLAGLPTDPAMREALEAQWREEGMHMDMSLEETDGDDDAYRADVIAPPMGENETLEAYVDRVVHGAAKEYSQTIRNGMTGPKIDEQLDTGRYDSGGYSFDNTVWGSGSEGAINIQDVRFEAEIPQFKRSPVAATVGATPGGAAAAPGSEVVAPTKEAWEAYIKKLEDRLSAVGDDAQLANVDLQNWLQKQQQVLQMMSNISKMLHDTAQAVIRKIGG